MSSADQWRWTDDEGVQRLLRGDELRAALADGRLKPTTLVWKRGMKNWIPANEVRELRAFIVDDDLPDTVTKEVPKNLGTKAVPTPSIPAPGIPSPNLVDVNALRAAGVRGPVNTLVGGMTTKGKKDSGARQELQIPAAPKIPSVDGGWNLGDRSEDTVTALKTHDEDGKTLSEHEQQEDTHKRKSKSTPKKKKTIPPPRKKKSTRPGALPGARKTPSRKPPPPAVRARRTAPFGGAASIKKTLKPKPPTPKPSVPPPVGSSEVLSEAFSAKKKNHGPEALAPTLTSAEPVQSRIQSEAKRVQQAVKSPQATPRAPAPSKPIGTPSHAEPVGFPNATPSAPPKPKRDDSRTGPLPGMFPHPSAPPGQQPAPKAPAAKGASAQAAAQSRQPAQSKQPAVSAQPASPSADAPDLGLGGPNRPTEVPPKPPMVAGLTLKYPVVAGIGAAALLAVVLSYVIGRVSAPPPAASLVIKAKTGWAVVPLFTRTRASTTPGPRPCLMLRAPSRFAPGATPRIPIEVASAPNDRIAIGFAQSATTPRGALVDPATGKSELIFNPEEPEADDEPKSIERIVPLVVGSDVKFGVTTQEADGLYRSVYVPAETPFVIGFDSENVLTADAPGGAAKRVWSLDEGAGRADALRVTTAMGHGFPLTYRQNKRGEKGFVYYAMLDQAGTIAHQALALGAPEGEVGKPNIASGSGAVSVVFAHRQKVEGARWELRWARGPVTDPLKDAALVDIPVGGPGGDAGAPAITPLSGGRWLLMWMEGSRGAWTIRAQTYDRKYRPVGEALRVSPETGNFGQGVVGVVGEKAVVVFLLENLGQYEVWGTVLQCQ